MNIFGFECKAKTYQFLKTMLKFFAAMFLLLSYESFAQFDNLGINALWNKGSINLTNGEKLIGFIQNNEQLHLIRFKSNPSDDEGSRLLKEEDIAMMEYLDSQSNTNRRFASINFKANSLSESLGGKKKQFDLKDEEIEGVALFEILMEYNQFAVLSRVTKVDVAKRTKKANALSAMDTKSDWLVTKKVGFEYNEEFYFFSDEGRLSTVLVLNYLERNRENYLLKSNRPENYKPDLNRAIVKRHMGQYWDEVEDYLDKNELNMKVKDDFLKLLEYYKELEKQ